jgi:colicin import membrane protein
MNVAVAALQYPEPGKIPSVVLAVAVHVLLAVFLFFGVRWQSSQPEAVMVELWVSPPAPVAERVEPRPEIKPEPIPVPKAEVKPAPQVEVPKPDITLEKKKELKKEIPRKEPPIKELPKKEPPKKESPAKEPPKLNLDRSKDIRAEVERESAAIERARVVDQMKRDGATAAAKADATYIGKLRDKIRSNVVLPPDISGNPEAIFDVVQLPTGEVISVKLRKSSGHKAYDDAVERAILKSSPLPRPERPEQFQRSLEIKFRPLDLK